MDSAQSGLTSAYLPIAEHGLSGGHARSAVVGSG